jgi:hypothetical protein
MMKLWINQYPYPIKVVRQPLGLSWQWRIIEERLLRISVDTIAKTHIINYSPCPNVMFDPP